MPGEVGTLEDRALLNGGGFKFPRVLGPVATLNYRGSHVLTSRTYGDVQNDINKAIQAFSNEVVRTYHATGGFTAEFDARVGVGTLGSYGYAPGTLLAKVDSIMQHVEKRLPYGGGYAGVTGGAGLSTFTSLTTDNQTVINLGRLSVAEQLEQAVATTPTLADARIAIEQVRQVTLNVVGRAPLAGPGAVPGSLANYVYQFGPGGARFFGLRNSK